MFSVVIVNFNSGKYLEQAILSVLNQTYKNFELLIVDGGSKDNSVEIVKKYASKISWWVSEPDKGQSDAFNKGFSHAKGDYFLWVNADDMILPSALQIIQSEIEKHPGKKWFFCNTLYINVEGVIFENSRGCNFPLYISKHGNIMPCGPTTVFHRSLFKKYGGFPVDNHYTMDVEMWRRYVSKGENYQTINRFCWVFRCHEESKTSAVFMGGTNERVNKEMRIINKKYNYKPYKFCILFQKAKRLIFCHPIMWYYKYHFKGKHIDTMINIDNIKV